MRRSAMSTGNVDAPPRKLRRPLTAVAAIGVLSTTVGVVALLTAPGATTVDGTTYDTTFVTEWLWWFAYVLVPVAAVLMRRADSSYAMYAIAAAALVLPHFVVAAVVVARYHWSGWASGLEMFAFLHPVGLFAATAVVLGISADAGAARRRVPAGTPASAAGFEP